MSTLENIAVTNQENCVLHLNFECFSDEDSFNKSSEMNSNIEKCSETVFKSAFLVMQEYGLKECQAGITFVTEQRIHELNLEYRDVDSPTDVLSFAMNDETDGIIPVAVGEHGLLGDIIISWERARGKLLKPESTPDSETAMLVIHGMLHLIGMDHKGGIDDGELIFVKQKELLEKSGYLF